MLRALVLLVAGLVARPAAGCETALLLAVDVSSSISLEEYALQMNGLADALVDPRIVTALVAGQDRLALVQWSGLGHQRLALPWQSFAAPEEVAAVADRVRAIRRPQLRTVTAIGQAIRFSLAQFDGLPPCATRVIDISGDGAENEGMSVTAARSEAEAAGVTINAIAIELDDTASDLTQYFRYSVITTGGFAITARGLPDYPRAIRDKLLRELIKVSS